MDVSIIYYSIIVNMYNIIYIYMDHLITDVKDHLDERVSNDF